MRDALKQLLCSLTGGLVGGSLVTWLVFSGSIGSLSNGTSPFSVQNAASMPDSLFKSLGSPGPPGPPGPPGVPGTAGTLAEEPIIDSSLKFGWRGDGFGLYWVQLPAVDMQFVKKMMQLMASRPYRDKIEKGQIANKKVLEMTSDVQPLGQNYNVQHPHFDSFWLVALAFISYVPASGLLLEFGVASGSSATLSGGILKKMTPRDRIMYGFDTFTGLPEGWGNFPKGAFAYDIDGKVPPVPNNVRLKKGLFSDTLPSFLADHLGPAAFINIDCDLYKGALFILQQMRGRLRPGTVIQLHELNQANLADELFALRDWLKKEGQGVKLEMLNIQAWGEAALLRVVSVPP